MLEAGHAPPSPALNARQPSAACGHSTTTIREREEPGKGGGHPAWARLHPVPLRPACGEAAKMAGGWRRTPARAKGEGESKQKMPQPPPPPPRERGTSPQPGSSASLLRSPTTRGTEGARARRDDSPEEEEAAASAALRRHSVAQAAAGSPMAPPPEAAGGERRRDAASGEERREKAGSRVGLCPSAGAGGSASAPFGPPPNFPRRQSGSGPARNAP